METGICISHLNDFIFCPKSIYFHGLFAGVSTRLYQGLPQVEGKLAHRTLDDSTYSTKKSIIQGVDIYSDRLGLYGKLDQFDMETGILTERKRRINFIYDGYYLQIYAQYYCLSEMGYEVKGLRLYSYDDNKVYEIPLPDRNLPMKELFFATLQSLESCNIESFNQTNVDKCRNCIYNNLCDQNVC